MIGAGVFAVFGPAAQAAGSWLLIGLLIAAVVAYCNAVASAQLAAVYPTSGGTYVYGRERLGAWWGFTAGWGFVIGKTASCAAMALTFASYPMPGSGWAPRLLAVVAVLGVAGLNLRGITKTALLTRFLVTGTLLALAVVVAAIAASGEAGIDHLDDSAPLGAAGPHGVLQSAGLLFFAFAGYARIATLGEEVRDPARTIPAPYRSPLASRSACTSSSASPRLAAGPTALAQSNAPLVTAVEAAGSPGAAPVVRVGSALASLGALLALIAGIGRTCLAMARRHDLPTWLASVNPRHRVPHNAEMALAVLVSILVLTTDLRGVIGFSSFGVLSYYAIANMAAFTQPAADRRWPRALNLLGVLGCLTLVATLPLPAVITGALLLTGGLIGRLLVLRLRQRRQQQSSTPRERGTPQ